MLYLSLVHGSAQDSQIIMAIPMQLYHHNSQEMIINIMMIHTTVCHSQYADGAGVYIKQTPMPCTHLLPVYLKKNWLPDISFKYCVLSLRFFPQSPLQILSIWI